MRKIPFIIILVVLFGLVSFSCKHPKNADTTNISEEVASSHKEASVSSEIYIPKDIKDCMIQLDSILGDSTKMNIKEMTKSSFSAGAHMDLGLWIRNNWGLRRGGALATYFNGLGLYNPDDISSVILNCYYNHLKGLEVNLKDEIENERFVDLMFATPEKESYPKEISESINLVGNFSYERGANDLDGFIHIIEDLKKKDYWAYDYSFGWKKIDLKMLDQLKKSKPDTRYSIVKSIFKD